MKKEIYNCLLCNATLDEPMTWRALLGRDFPRTICTGCEEKFEPMDYVELEGNQIISLYKYNDQMKDYLHRYKFMHDVVLAKVFRNEIRRFLFKSKEIIVPIPIHPIKLKERTFAHVDELLKAAEIPYEHLLEKISTETQGQKTREERINTGQLFKVKENVVVKNRDILLVDDIITTGTTVKHAKKVLYEAGAKSVKVFSLIRSV
nr:phosphoribosyltransferase family protein [Lysinibacillus timonensis]